LKHSYAIGRGFRRRRARRGSIISFLNYIQENACEGRRSWKELEGGSWKKLEDRSWKELKGRKEPEGNRNLKAGRSWPSWVYVKEAHGIEMISYSIFSPSILYGYALGRSFLC
jgi:hypothetical protein